MITELPFCAVEPLDPIRRRLLASALEQILTPAQLTVARELQQAANPCCREPRPEDILYWIRLNMPVAASKLEDVLHPND
jgi:hypothetical protein